MSSLTKEECKEAINTIVERVYELAPYAFDIRVSADVYGEAPEFYISVNGRILSLKKEEEEK